jgi:molecular chaperone GrpE (heat shock protein)
VPISQSCPSEAAPEVVQETAATGEAPNQDEELTDGALADDSETPSQDDETPDSENELLQRLMSIVEANRELSQQLVKDFDTKLKYDVAKQEQIDKLYNENQEYKQGIHEKLKKSLVLAVIEQIDGALKQIAHFGNQEFSEENYRKLLNNYNEIATDFQDALAQSFDVVAYNCEENTPFDAKRQKSLKTIPTADETKNKTISKSLRQGYEITNSDGTTTILRPEMVEVYVHQAPQS